MDQFVMRDFVTFFRDRERDPGRTYAWTVEGPEGPSHYAVYARQPLEDTAMMQERRVVESEAFSRYQDRLDRAVGHAAGGLVLQASAGANSGSRARIRVLRERGYRPPSRVLLIAPGAPAGMVELSTKELELPFGGHLVVPADEESHEMLVGLLGYLRGLPSDLEHQILRNIAEPALDGAVSRLERKHVLRQARSWPIAVAVLLVLNVILTVLLLRRPVGNPEATGDGSASPFVIHAVPSEPSEEEASPQQTPALASDSGKTEESSDFQTTPDESSAGSEPRPGGHRRVRDDPVEDALP